MADDDVVHAIRGSAGDCEEGGIWRILESMPYVIIRDLRLVEQQEGVLEIVQHVLFGTGIADILEEIHVRLVGAPELLVQGMDLADFV